MKFKYKTEDFTPRKNCSLDDWLNQRGLDGWQLVSLREFGYESYKVVWMLTVSTAAKGSDS